MNPPRFPSPAPMAAFLAATAAVLTAGLSRAQGFAGLEQRCQFGTPALPTVSLDTPTASIANNYNWIVQVANSQLQIKQYPNTGGGMNHLSGLQIPGGAIPTFFGPLGANRVVDNKVMCDAATGRFCVIGMQQDSMAVGSAPQGQGLYVAWSDSAFPSPNPISTSGGWHRWKTPVPTVPAPGVYQPDFNGMGQTDTHFVYSGILQPVTFPNGPAFSFVRLLSKANLSSFPGSPTVQDLPPVQIPTSEFLHAADNYDAGSPVYLAAVLIGNQQLRLLSVDPTTLAQTPFLLNVAPFSPANGAAPQPGGGYLDTIDGRMQSVVVRDGFMFCCHTIVDYTAGPGRHVVRWYQIALNGWPNGGSPVIVQSGDINLGGTLHAYMPSLAVNWQGTLAITFTSSSATQNPRIEWRGRFATDSVNTTLRGAVLFTSVSPYTTSGGTGGTPNADRWGDWSSIVPRNVPGSETFVICGPVGLSGPPQLYPLITPLPPNHWGTRIEPFDAVSPPWWLHYPDPLGLGGGGLAGTNGVPLISAWPRTRIGQTTTVTVTNCAGAPTLGVALLSLAAGTGVASPFGPVWVDLAQATSIGFALPGANGSFPLAFPTDPLFISFQFFLQAAVIDGGSSTGFGVTQGLGVTVGS